jgi:hypothetical protein
VETECCIILNLVSSALTIRKICDKKIEKLDLLRSKKYTTKIVKGRQNYIEQMQNFLTKNTAMVAKSYTLVFFSGLKVIKWLHQGSITLSIEDKFNKKTQMFFHFSLLQQSGNKIAAHL